MMKPGKEMDDLVIQAMGEEGPSIGFSTDDGLAMIVFNWMSRRGLVVLSNGDTDSYDCDWVPSPLMYNKTAIIRAMEGIDCESFAHAICLALLVGTGKVTLGDKL